MSLFSNDIESQATIDEGVARAGTEMTAAVTLLLSGIRAILDEYEIQLQFVKKESK